MVKMEFKISKILHKTTVTISLASTDENCFVFLRKSGRSILMICLASKILYQPLLRQYMVHTY
jgi:hypothetical protein